jgi:hypothetical protein
MSKIDCRTQLRGVSAHFNTQVRGSFLPLSVIRRPMAGISLLASRTSDNQLLRSPKTPVHSSNISDELQRSPESYIERRIHNLRSGTCSASQPPSGVAILPRRRSASRCAPHELGDRATIGPKQGNFSLSVTRCRSIRPNGATVVGSARQGMEPCQFRGLQP